MPNEFDVIFDTAQSMECAFNEDSFSVDFADVKTADYTGTYQVTPSNQTQILPTSGKTLELNIVVDPIPSNYGLIEWNGNYLKVS